MVMAVCFTLPAYFWVKVTMHAATHASLQVCGTRSAAVYTMHWHGVHLQSAMPW